MRSLRLRKSSKSVIQCDFSPRRYIGSRAASRKIFQTLPVFQKGWSVEIRTDAFRNTGLPAPFPSSEAHSDK